MTLDPTWDPWPVALGAPRIVREHCELFRWDSRRRTVFRTEPTDPRLAERDAIDLVAKRSGVYEVVRGWEWIVSCVHISYAWGLLDVYYQGVGEPLARVGGPHATSEAGYKLVRPWQFRELLPIQFEFVVFKADNLSTVLSTDVDIILVGAMVQRG